MPFLSIYRVRSVIESSFAAANSFAVRASSLSMSKIRLVALLIFTSLALSSCGFQLAGTAPDAASFDSVYVDNRVGIQQLINQQVADQLLNDLDALSDNIFDRAQANIPGLIIVNEENIERGLSLTSDLFERQIEIEKRVQYQILDGSGNILVTDMISATRTLIEDQSNPSAKQQERERLISAINRDISRQLIRQLGATLAKIR